jgi:ferredoxin-type protein NapG
MDTQPLKNKKPVLRRREVIQGAAGAGILLALGAYGSYSRADTFIRPPGVRSDKDFFERCLRCDRCRSVCPTHVIRSGKLEDGLTEIRSPIMDFHLGHCDFCSKCIEVCSLGALQPIDKEKEKIGLAELTEICIALRTGGCTKCHEECPYDAISLDDQKRPVIDPEVCNGCGMCEYVCPANVFQSSARRGMRGIEVVPRRVSSVPSEEKGNV